MVDNAFAPYFKQWFWSFLCKWTESLSFATSHQYCIDRQTGDVFIQVDYFYYMVVCIEDRHEFHLLFPLLMKILHIVINSLAKEIEVAMNNFFYGIIY